MQKSEVVSPWPVYAEDEVQAVVDVLKSGKVNYWTGTLTRQFETEFAQFSGVKHAIAVANGTVALDLILVALGIGPGDEVIVTPRTFLASVSAIILAGATPVFADIDTDTQNITAGTISAKLGPKTRAVLCVHLAGWPCDMDPICALAREKGLYVIEDCAQAHGGMYKGRKLGGLGDAAAWSFCQDKIMTTGGEGGMVTTNSTDLWEKMWSYKDHGKSWAAVYNNQHPPGFRWLHESFGTNWRLTEMQAAIGLRQLEKMPLWHRTRLRNAMQIWQAASVLPAVRVPVIPDTIEHAAYKCYVFVRPERLENGWTRDRIIKEINDEGVPCFSGSCSEVYLEKAFDQTSYRPEQRLIGAKELGETSLMFLVHPTLSERELENTCKTLTSVVMRATRGSSHMMAGVH